MKRGALVISLDFELYWGMRDHVRLGAVERRLAMTREAVESMLDLFLRYEVHATWATVGLLFLDGRTQAEAYRPAVTPAYRAASLLPYPELDGLGDGESMHPAHFAPSLVRRIAETPHQEVASHTFGHYYCLEPGDTLAAFEADVEAARRAATALGVKLESMVFPRNQFAERHVAALPRLGFHAFRGTPGHWAYRAASSAEQRPIRRAVRFVDSYVNLTGHHLSRPRRENGSINVAASRFLRPYSPKLAMLEPLRIKRVTDGIREAARTRTAFHLWWHPHNFGDHLDENLRALERALRETRRLVDARRLDSFNMRELALTMEGDTVDA